MLKDASFTRREIDELTKIAVDHGAKDGLDHRNEDELRSPITKFFTTEQIERVLQTLDAQPGDLVVQRRFSHYVARVMGAMLELGKRLGLIDDTAVCLGN